MKKIRIVAVPPGFAPKEIRQQWVGVEIPLSGEDPTGGIWVGTGNENGYVVSADDAISALRNAGKDDAADFWEGLRGTALRFNKQVCEPIEG